jgi:hypothetical protein
MSVDMVQLEPDANPLYVMTNNAKQSKGSMTPKFEWPEDAEVNLWDFGAEGADKAAAATTLTVNDVTLFLVNDLIAIPKANSSSAAEEVALVTGIAGSILTLTRGIGGGADTILATGSIRIIGGAFAEGAALPLSRTTNKAVVVSGCQIFRNEVEITNTMLATETFMTEDEENYQLGKTLKRHRSEIEAAGLWGRYSETLASPSSRWTTKGLKATIATNVTDMGTTMTATKLLTFSETAFRYGKKSKLAIAAPRVISGFNFIAQGAVRIDNNATVYGVKINRYQTPQGDLLLANNFRLEAGISGKLGFDDECYVADLEAIRFRYLAGNGQNRNTKLRVDVRKDGADAKASEYYTQAGWQIMHEKRHARFFNCTAFA